jgi:hypothetical protein
LVKILLEREEEAKALIAKASKLMNKEEGI